MPCLMVLGFLTAHAMTACTLGPMATPFPSRALSLRVLLRQSRVFSEAEMRGVQVLFSPFTTIYLWLFGKAGWSASKDKAFHVPKAHVDCRVNLAQDTTSGWSSGSRACTMRLLP